MNGQTLPIQLSADRRSDSAVERAIAIGIFGALLLVNIALINLRVENFPVRAAAAIVLLGGLSLLYPNRVLAAVRRLSPVLWLTAGFAVLGTVVSFANGTDLETIWDGIQEIPLQIAITLIVTTVLVQIAGPKAGVTAFVVVVGASTFVALLQFLDIKAAWSVRDWLSRVQHEVALTALVRGRPVGLSYSPIQLSTQICLAFAVYATMREQLRADHDSRAPADPMILIALAAMVAGAIFTLTRSPILGGVIFVVLYMIRRPGAWLLVIGLLAGAVLYMIGPIVIEMLQESAPRLVRTDDNSAQARVSMNEYGILLIKNNPIGYGFGFMPTKYIGLYWQQLYDTPHPSGLMNKELHNYLLNMLNMYGIGIVLLLIPAVTLLKKGKFALLFFIPYVVHIIFHNSGPFWNDVPFWFAVAILVQGFSSGADRTEEDEIEAPRYRWEVAGAPAGSEVKPYPS